MEYVITSAADVLDRYWDMTLPVNPTAIAYRMGVCIKFDPSVRGSGTVSYLGDIPVVFLNPRDTTVQQRFDIFRGLGEIILSTTRAGEGRPSLSETEAFAAEMILPRKAVALYATNHMPIPRMAEMFGVTETAMRIRLGRLGLVSVPPGSPVAGQAV